MHRALRRASSRSLPAPRDERNGLDLAVLQLVALGYLKLLARLLDPACSDVLPPSVFCDLR